MKTNLSDTARNLIDMYETMRTVCPITVGAYIDRQLPKRHTDTEQAQYAEILLNTFVEVSQDDLFDIDFPVTEASVVRGFSQNGAVAIKTLMRWAEAGKI
ncbi:hypothetical protein [Pseudomonas aeruginosa]|uniref:hypothetical protein n=1 Tax=Pseudomonas aeruginosa TaxID=287 RepID=UPI00021202EA|nr:hypothetical protein [Pseudomonas aeruginosa]DBA08855.1 TPA_asm: hypothetical protein [Pseudomonas phage vB_PaeS-D14P]EKT8051182.1 hypothetical protein [Pseudomonas aeruginosa]ELH4224854.1 hypothetical protein [Pseudomonas aeruginosa]EME92752.1 hypothetical protein H123_18195 [Pseudomonas aeruginosa PA21_ST175]ERF07312.1 hypothetical protein PA13_1014405 [Pseudomonas aeruginosa HB13]